MQILSNFFEMWCVCVCVVCEREKEKERDLTSSVKNIQVHRQNALLRN